MTPHDASLFRDVTHKQKHLPADQSHPCPLQGTLSQAIVVDESTWGMEGSTVDLSLCKGSGSQGWWDRVVEGDKPIDMTKVRHGNALC